uniref:GRASP55_65 domain-containing protein n=1 Tax=Panagrellus redivivus TaxID=6233 RepID=A0A7E4VQR1_PANRE
MGQSASTQIPGGGTEGYHVLRVQDNSPGQAAGLEAFFDYIVAIGDTRLDKDDDALKNLLKSSVEQPIELTVFNSKTQTIRQTQITPSEHWGGQGLLGVSIRFCSFEGANSNVWHIISVKPNSPAALAGLQSNNDYVLGAESVLNQADDLIALVQANVGKQLKLYVYNVVDDQVREVTLTPNDTWGGDGCLGCDIGYGYLHRIPVSVDRSKLPEQQQPTNGTAVNVEFAQSNIAKPGYTGIPQIDNSVQNLAAKQFPDPSEFNVTGSGLPPAPPPVNVYQPGVPTSQQYDFTKPFIPQADVQSQNSAAVSTPPPQQQYQPYTAPTSVPQPQENNYNGVANGQYSPPVAASTYQPYLAYGAPPGTNATAVPSYSSVSSTPSSLPAATTPQPQPSPAPQAQTPVQQYNQYQTQQQREPTPVQRQQTPVQQFQQQSPPLPQQYYQQTPQQQAYQPYNPAGATGYTSIVPPMFSEQTYPTNYHLPPTSTGYGAETLQQYPQAPITTQPAPISFPMPPLSALGIQNLVPPPPAPPTQHQQQQQYGADAYSAPPQYQQAQQ